MGPQTFADFNPQQGGLYQGIQMVHFWRFGGVEKAKEVGG